MLCQEKANKHSPNLWIDDGNILSLGMVREQAINWTNFSDSSSALSGHTEMMHSLASDRDTSGHARGTGYGAWPLRPLEVRWSTWLLLCWARTSYSVSHIWTSAVQIDGDLSTKDLSNVELSPQAMFYFSLSKLNIIALKYMAREYLCLQLHLCVVPELNSVFNQY